jgi:hypothetical protein
VTQCDTDSLKLKLAAALYQIMDLLNLRFHHVSFCQIPFYQIPDLLNLTFYKISFYQIPLYQIPDLKSLTYYQILFFSSDFGFVEFDILSDSFLQDSILSDTGCA